MERTRARTAAQAELDHLSSSDNPLQLVDDDDVVDIGWAWVYAWNTVRWFRTHDPADQAGPGAGPIVVVKGSEAAFALASAPSFDLQLREYAAEHGLAAPTQLGW